MMSFALTFNRKAVLQSHLCVFGKFNQRASENDFTRRRCGGEEIDKQIEFSSFGIPIQAAAFIGGAIFQFELLTMEARTGYDVGGCFKDASAIYRKGIRRESKIRIIYVYKYLP